MQINQLPSKTPTLTDLIAIDTGSTNYKMSISDLYSFISAAWTTQVVTRNETESFAAGQYKGITISAALSGYTPVGIIGVKAVNGSKFSFCDRYISGSSAVIYFRNDQATASELGAVEATVLYKKA